jgi:hypothetical protein
MTESSRIKFNPVTEEIEIEGSEKFVKTYFDRIQKMLSKSQEAPSIKAPVKEKPVKEKAGKVAKKKTAKKKAKKVSNADKVLTLIKESAEGSTTAELKENTGLTEQQIWAIVNVAKKQGKIMNAKRGLYVVA